jgi:hypothetical protein
MIQAEKDIKKVFGTKNIELQYGLYYHFIFISSKLRRNGYTRWIWISHVNLERKQAL